ncbi:molybdopterin synthase sulfur carrier subunit [Chryseobacterium lactis]|uniref:Molybdopterin synthase sulfur carrier subunit n=1 Tax=Chryseobacterium lactis TaxID=1241981 RepID=A0A3G6RRS7_CHRLC|nr:MoaD/ThiS family protein [Chryseobacterium lactis]AZA84356.1 MoaD/ThiS family protein [Chryseobacterium lactis]AZB04744.1 MoaD/ThiS family protein [Chryseobacterium lactis]PNW14474.1 molybdopterin synthase sulfur carrier subunit [Chryseobacterium lactis]
MTIKILAFGITKDILGTTKKEVEINEGTNVGELKELLEKDFPELKRLKSYFIAIDDEYAEDHQIITINNELAIIPPVSGG